MKLFIDLTTRRFVKSAASSAALPTLVLKRRDVLPVEVVFVQRGAAVETPAGTVTKVALKSKFSDANFLALADSGTLDLYTQPVEDLFVGSTASADALLEVRYTRTGEATRTATLQVEIQNSVILGDEGTPAAVPDGKATQAEAEAGTDNEKWMTPLRTAQAIAELAPPPTWNSVTGKPSTFPPSAHTHTASQITDFASAVVAVSPPVDWSNLTGKPSTFAPSAHTHLKSEITGLDSDLAALSSADTALGQRIDYLAANLDPAALDSIAEAAASIGSLQTQINGKAPTVHTHPASAITGLSDYIIASAPGLSIVTTTHIADGLTDTYSVSGLTSSNPSHVIVSLNGVTQNPDSDYIVNLASGTIIFDDYPATGTQIVFTALGLRSVQPPLDPTLYLYAFDTSANGLTTYSGRLLNTDRPAAPALPETATSWTIRRSTLNAAGRVIATATATGSWLNRETLTYA